jgi:hypothetical protein
MSHDGVIYTTSSNATNPVGRRSYLAEVAFEVAVEVVVVRRHAGFTTVLPYNVVVISEKITCT